MSKSSQQFKNKIKDLDNNEFEHPDDFFTRASSMEPSGQRITADLPQQLNNADEMWIDTSNEGYEGQLAVDVYQDEQNVYVKAIVGGAVPEEIEVHLNNDMLSIKGKRVKGDEGITPEQFYIQECFWGGFSRSIILPVDVQNEHVNADIENGVLMITLPKSTRPKNSRIPIKEVK